MNYSGSIPRVGRTGVIGFLVTALRYTVDAETVIREGKAKYADQPFAVPTLAGPVFLLRPEFLDKVRASTDQVLNEPMTVDDDLQLPYTMDEHQLKNPYQATVLRTDVNRALPSYIPEMLEESILAIEDALGPLKTTDGHFELPVFDTMTHLIARVSNRVVFGLGLCRDEGFLRAIVRFAETLPLMAPFIRWTPHRFRPVTYSILSRIFGGKREPLRYILPYLQDHFDNHKSLSDATVSRAFFFVQIALAFGRLLWQSISSRTRLPKRRCWDLQHGSSTSISVAFIPRLFLSLKPFSK